MEASSPPPEVPLSTPEPFGSDLLLAERLGSGATGEVRRATVRSSGEQVAVKLLRPDLASDPVLVARFLQEADVLRRLSHPHLVRLRDVVLEGGRLGLVVDLVDGGDLRRRLQEAGRLTPADAAEVVAQVAAALTAVHDAGVTHRDVKPANVLLAADGSARLADLGIARLASSPELTRHTGVVGTPDYLAPEASEGEAGAPSDVYALGVVLHELLAGQVPFRAAHPVAVLRLHLEAAPPVLPVPAPLAALLAETLAKDPAARPTAAQVEQRLRELQPSLAGVPALTATPAAALPESASALTNVRARPVAAAAPAAVEPASRRRPLLLAAAAGVTALALVGAAAAFTLRDEPRTDLDLAARSAEASPSASAGDPTTSAAPSDAAVPVGPVEGLPPAGAPVGDAGPQAAVAGPPGVPPAGSSDAGPTTVVPPAGAPAGSGSGTTTSGSGSGSAPAPQPAPAQTTSPPTPAPAQTTSEPAPAPAPAQTTQAPPPPPPPPPPTQPAAIPGAAGDVRDRRCSGVKRTGVNGATVETVSCIGYITSSTGRQLVQSDTYAREVPGSTHNAYGQFRVWAKLHAADGTLITERICDVTADFNEPTRDGYWARCGLSADTAGAGRYTRGFARGSAPAMQTDSNLSQSPSL